MAYRLPLTHVRDGVTAVAEAELARLSIADTAGNAAQIALEQRKALKKLRALCALVRTPRNGRRLDRLDRALRDRGRQLAGVRLQGALQTTLDRLVADGAKVPQRVLRTLRRHLAPQDHAASISLDVEHLARMIRELPLKRVSLKSMIANAARTYRAARAALDLAVAHDTSEALHEWRKHVQRHTRQMQLLRDLWPEEMSVRVMAGKSLARLLGEEHDLHEFSVWLGTIEGPKPSRRELLRAIERRQTDLRREAQVLGLKLFAERPKAFRRRLAAYAR